MNGINGTYGGNMSSNNPGEMKEKSMGQEGNSSGELLHPMVSQMAQYHKYIVIGTTMG